MFCDSGVKAFVEKKGETLYNIFLNELNHNIKKEFDQFRRESHDPGWSLRRVFAFQARVAGIS
jgi:hypothetical protein